MSLTNLRSVYGFYLEIDIGSAQKREELKSFSCVFG